MTQTVKVGLIVLVAAALATTGVAVALDDDPGGAPPAAAGAAAGEPAASRMAERIRDRLQPLVDREVIDERQADAVAGHLAEGLPSSRRLEAPGRGARIRLGAGEIAEFFDMTPEELHDAVMAGATLDELLAEAGATAAEFEAALLTAAEAHLDEALDAGRITADQKAEMLDRASERIGELIDGGFPGAGALRGPHRAPGALGGPPHRFPAGVGPGDCRAGDDPSIGA